MNNKVIIVGAFHEVIELAKENGFEIVGLIDNEKVGSYKGYQILCNDDEVKNNCEILKEGSVVITPDKPALRRKLQLYYNGLGCEFASLISKNAKISKSAKVGVGAIIQYGVNVSAECEIGKFVKLNTLCNIMHNSIIGDYTTIAPNAVILGNVKIGKYCYIGANATVLPNIEICDNAIIGAGAVVVKNIKESKIFVGNPAKQLIK